MRRSLTHKARAQRKTQGRVFETPLGVFAYDRCTVILLRRQPDFFAIIHMSLADGTAVRIARPLH